MQAAELEPASRQAMVDGIHAERQGLVQPLRAVTDPFQPFTQLFDNEQLIRALLHGMTGFNSGYSSLLFLFCSYFSKESSNRLPLFNSLHGKRRFWPCSPSSRR
ncbi:hypothetical protein D3C86_1054730 [compost metagenome]